MAAVREQVGNQPYFKTRYWRKRQYSKLRRRLMKNLDHSGKVGYRGWTT